MDKSILIQRAEGLSFLALAIFLYNELSFSWLWFGLLLFSMDVFMIGYLKSAKLGAYTYNIGHSYAVPIVLGMIGWNTEVEWLLGLAIIWTAHIGLDRALGYGLKSERGFTHTHLGRIGKK